MTDATTAGLPSFDVATLITAGRHRSRRRRHEGPDSARTVFVVDRVRGTIASWIR